MSTAQFQPGEHVQLTGPEWADTGMLGHVVTIEARAVGGGYFSGEPGPSPWYVDAERDSEYAGTPVTVATNAANTASPDPDADASIREALATWREAEAAYAAACEEEEETGREKEPDAYYARDDAAVEFATVAAAWIAARLGVSE